MADIQFNGQQTDAIQEANHWFRDWEDRKHRKQDFFLSGYAGTGKTTVAQTIAELCAPPHLITYVAPTGKAASRLRQKGCRGARTLHQFIYNLAGEDEDGNPIFTSKTSLKEQPRLVVCDEGSMLGEYDRKQLLSHGIPSLILGDIGQLEPVKAVQAYTEQNMDVLLTEIMRQSADSNIVRASMFVRNGKRLPLREYDDVRVREGQISSDEMILHAREDGQIICAFNKTRQEVNAAVRAQLRYDDRYPMIGEKVICTSNQHAYDFMNGEQGIVIGYEDLDEYLKQKDYKADGDKDFLPFILIRSLTNGREYRLKFNPNSFSEDPDALKEAQKSPGGFDFGYCITIHKSQGSEWEKVLVIEQASRDNYAKMMYTAYTRAIRQLTVYRGS